MPKEHKIPLHNYESALTSTSHMQQSTYRDLLKNPERKGASGGLCSCEHGNKLSGVIWKTLEKLSDWWLLEKDSAPWS
jgi:hypothetical protein